MHKVGGDHLRKKRITHVTIGGRNRIHFMKNKNRLCSKTCGIDIDIEDKKDHAKIEEFFS